MSRLVEMHLPVWDLCRFGTSRSPRPAPAAPSCPSPALLLSCAAPYHAARSRQGRPQMGRAPLALRAALTAPLTPRGRRVRIERSLPRQLGARQVTHPGSGGD
jgi:hypothetical protein